MDIEANKIVEVDKKNPVCLKFGNGREIKIIDDGENQGLTITNNELGESVQHICSVLFNEVEYRGKHVSSIYVPSIVAVGEEGEMEKLIWTDKNLILRVKVNNRGDLDQDFSPEWLKKGEVLELAGIKVRT